METSGSPLACDQAGDAEMNQEVLSMVGPLQHTMRRKETGNLKLLNFFLQFYHSLQIPQDQFHVSSHEVMTHPKGVSCSCSAAAGSETLG